MAWTTSDTRYESTGIQGGGQSYLLQGIEPVDSAPNDRYRSNLIIKNSEDDHTPAADGLKKRLEEFVQSIQTFLTDKKNLVTEARGKKKTLHLLIPNVRFIGKGGREVFGMPIPDALLTDEITSAPYYSRYLEHLSRLSPQHLKHIKSQNHPNQQQLNPPRKTKVKKRKLVKETFDAPSLTKRSKAGKVTKQQKPKSPLQLVDEFVDEGVPEQEPIYGDEEADIQRAVELSIKEQAERTQGPARPVVIREPNSGRIQPLLDVHGKGKEKVSDEQVALDLLTLQTPKKKSPAEQYIFHRRTPTTTEPSGHAESPSLYAKLGQTDSETESNEEVSPEINVGTQDEGQAGPNPGEQDEGQAGPNPGIQNEGQAGSNPGDVAESQP
ncbi:retrovirus-related pol polyprotein from transposon TNT 1-94 [Tanacetum coccineum]